MKTEFTMFNKESFAALYRELREDEGLMTTLAHMQVERGIPERKAFENANDMIRLVAERENLEDMLSEDAKATLDKFLHESNKMGSYDRKVLLHQLYFGLKLYQDPELVDQLQEGVSMEKLFHDYYTRWGEDPSITEEMLEEQVNALIANHHISPQAMRVIARRLKRNANTLATSAVLGEQGQRFKCVAAMELYLRNQDTLTMEEAVNAACTSVQTEAVADAVSSGQIADDRAMKILLTIFAASLLASIILPFIIPMAANAMDSLAQDSATEVVRNIFSSDAYIIATEGVRHETNDAIVQAAFHSAPRAQSVVDRVRQMYRISDGLFFGSLAIGAVSEKAAELVGRMVAKHKFVRSDKEFLVAEAMNAMADRAEAAQEAAERAESTCTSDCVHTAEAAHRQEFEQDKTAQARQLNVFG